MSFEIGVDTTQGVEYTELESIIQIILSGLDNTSTAKELSTKFEELESCLDTLIGSLKSNIEFYYVVVRNKSPRSTSPFTAEMQQKLEQIKSGVSEIVNKLKQSNNRFEGKMFILFRFIREIQELLKISVLAPIHVPTDFRFGSSSEELPPEA